MKSIFFGIYIILVNVTPVMASDIISVKQTDNLVFTGVTNQSFTLGSTDPAGDAHSESTAPAVFVPMEGLTADGADNTPYFSLKSEGVTDIFDYSTSLDSANYISFPVRATVGDTVKYPHLAVKYGSNYYVVKRITSVTSLQNVTDLEFNVDITPDGICDVESAAGSTSCNNLVTTATTSSIQEITAVVFLSSSIMSENNQVDSSLIDTNATYVKFKLSNRVYTYPGLTVTLSELRKGDRRLTGSFTTSATMDSMYFSKVIVFKHDTSNPGCDNQPTGSCSGTYFDQDVSNSQSGSFTIYGLVNITPYTVSIALMDKFKFATTLSNSITQTPVSIEELLKKQNCFLLTAGFGEEHFVIDYFRNFRDETLIKYDLGKLFISKYYQYAPKFALSIYNNHSIRFAIRIFAYALYFLFNYFAWFLVIFLISFLFYRKNKSKKFKNSYYNRIE